MDGLLSVRRISSEEGPGAPEPAPSGTLTWAGISRVHDPEIRRDGRSLGPGGVRSTRLG